MRTSGASLKRVVHIETLASQAGQNFGHILLAERGAMESPTFMQINTAISRLKFSAVCPHLGLVLVALVRAPDARMGAEGLANCNCSLAPNSARWRRGDRSPGLTDPGSSRCFSGQKTIQPERVDGELKPHGCISSRCSIIRNNNEKVK